jgi:hypothetical protein
MDQVVFLTIYIILFFATLWSIIQLLHNSYFSCFLFFECRQIWTLIRNASFVHYPLHFLSGGLVIKLYWIKLRFAPHAVVWKMLAKLAFWVSVFVCRFSFKTLLCLLCRSIPMMTSIVLRYVFSHTYNITFSR